MTDVAIGQPVKRSEDERFLTGRGRYIDDINLEGQARAAVLRSVHAHADIKNIDASQALAMEGVLLVVTGQDWIAEGFGPMPTKTAVRKNRDGSELSEPPRHCLAIDRVRYVGEPVALVVAETDQIARDALDLINVDYESLDAVTDAVKALTPDAPQLWDDIPGNLCIDFELGDREGVEKAFEEADHVITLDLENNRVTAVPIEPRGCVGGYDPETETYLLYNATQNVHANRDTFAENVFGIDKEKIHHIAPDVGGGFGVKNSAYPEPPLVLYAAKKLGRPVKWINNRSESFLSDTHGRGQTSRVQLAIDNDGTFRALRTETVAGIGAYCWTIGPFTPTGGSARTQGGPYDFPVMYYRGRAVFINTGPMDPYRGAGRPEATFQTERIIEYAARQLGMDPVEIRRKNLMPPEKLPHKTSMGLNIDCGDFPKVFERTLELADPGSFAERAEQSKTAGRLFGFAIAPYLECTGGGPKEFAGVAFRADGTVSLSVGSQSTGMGHETSMAQLLAARLGIPFERVEYHQADTDKTPIGGGHGGSRGLELGGNAVAQAAQEVIEKASGLAAHLLQSKAADLTFEGGSFTDSGSGASVSMVEVIEASFDPERLPDDLEPGCLDTGSTFERGEISIPNGCHAAAVEVDPETGAIRLLGYWVVDDFGTIINPLLADGQVMGGVAQGIGQVLTENIVFDESGQLITGSLMDYGLPRADAVPDMVIEYYEGAPTKKNPLGVKGAGEAGCVGSLPAVVNAVLDALKEFGVVHIDIPLTPEKVWRAIQDQGAHDPKGLMENAL
ncbi:MAG: carbon monoxide dehydrogenase [Rhodospirillaceae bacterium]|jgi:carbon-monoxide dehydrogenase large subunit|nr:carbon monoxide dehydrogenase [Rhodospirillaceae bacterium]|tara:strand:+ start:1916 stop:4282 length:2367 start_codon:yes stop_codon:yes gene_type:complete